MKPALERLLAEAIGAWASEFDNDEEVSGADLVDWFADWRLRLRAELGNHRAPPDPSRVLQAIAREGDTVVLTTRRGNGVLRVRRFVVDKGVVWELLEGEHHRRKVHFGLLAAGGPPLQATASTLEDVIRKNFRRKERRNFSKETF